MYTSENNQKNYMYKTLLKGKESDVFNPYKLIKNRINGLYFIENIDAIKPLIASEYDTEIPDGLSGFLEVSTYMNYESYENESYDVNDIITIYSSSFTEEDLTEETGSIEYQENNNSQDYYFTYDDKYLGELAKENKLVNIPSGVKDNITESKKPVNEKVSKYGLLPISPYDDNIINENRKVQLVLIRYNLKLSNGMEYEADVSFEDNELSQFIIDTYTIETINNEYKVFESILLTGKYIKNAKITFLDDNNNDFTGLIEKYVNTGSLIPTVNIAELNNVRPYLKIFFKTAYVEGINFDYLSRYASAGWSGPKVFSDNEYRKPYYISARNYVKCTDLYAAKNEDEGKYYDEGDFRYNIDKDVIITRGAIKYQDEWWDPTSFESSYMENGMANFRLINGELQFTYNNQFPTRKLPCGKILDIEKVSNDSNLYYDRTNDVIEDISGENTYYFISDYIYLHNSFKTKFKLEFKGLNSESEIKTANHYVEYGYKDNPAGGGQFNRNPFYLNDSIFAINENWFVPEIGYARVENPVVGFMLPHLELRHYDINNNGYYFYKQGYNDFVTLSYNTINTVQAQNLRDGDNTFLGHKYEDHLAGKILELEDRMRRVSIDIIGNSNVRPVTDFKEFNTLKYRRVTFDSAYNKKFEVRYANGGYNLFKDSRHFDDESNLFEIEGWEIENLSEIKSIPRVYTLNTNPTTSRNPVEITANDGKKVYIGKKIEGRMNFGGVDNVIIPRFFDAYYARLTKSLAYRVMMRRMGAYGITSMYSAEKWIPKKCSTLKLLSFFYQRKGRVRINPGAMAKKFHRNTSYHYPITKYVGDLGSGEYLNAIYNSRKVEPRYIDNVDGYPVEITGAYMYELYYGDNSGISKEVGDPVFEWTLYRIRAGYGRIVNQKSIVSFTHPIKTPLLF